MIRPITQEAREEFYAWIKKALTEACMASYCDGWHKGFQKGMMIGAAVTCFFWILLLAVGIGHSW